MGVQKVTNTVSMICVDCFLCKFSVTGMENTDISYEDTQDPAGCNWGPDRYSEFSRDPARTPMQWDNTSFAGKKILIWENVNL